MEILFIIDTIEDLDKKISLINNFEANIKFFVKSDLVAKLINNKFVIDNIVSIYNKNINETIDKYLKSGDYKPTKTLLYYASAPITAEVVNKIKNNIALKPSTIYVKKKFNAWAKFKIWLYQKLVKLIFGLNDAYASVKLQYLSAEFMVELAETNFKNHVFEVPKSLTLEIDKQDEKQYYPKVKFNKNYLYNPIVFCLILICYVLLEKFFNLQFWVYLLVIAILLITIVNLIVMIIKNNIDERFKK